MFSKRDTPEINDPEGEGGEAEDEADGDGGGSVDPEPEEEPEVVEAVHQDGDVAAREEPSVQERRMKEMKE